LRDETVFHDRVTADGSSGFAAQTGRYHLYVSYACPWASRALLVRKLKKLEDVISVSVVHPFMGPDGWTFDAAPGTIPDTVNHTKYLRDVYVLAKRDYTGRVTVPVLWDKQTRTIVNNASRDILRMLDTEFDAFGDASLTFCPADLRERVDAEITALYAPVNDGVYRAGFAEKQEAYDEAVTALFAALDRYEERLAGHRYLLGDTLTEADWCFFTTLIRFDLVYHYHFKCNLRRIRDYPSLWGYVRDLYQHPGVRDTVRFDHIREHYYRSHDNINPHRIVPQGPLIDFDEPHGREQMRG
jgi:putative glutathione S-transferase